MGRCSNGKPVGAVELRPSGSEAGVSYLLAPELRGQGLASRALAALIAWGTLELGLRRINLGCHVDNTASQRVAERCGFSFVCRDGDELRFRRDTMPATQPTYCCVAGAEQVDKTDEPMAAVARLMRRG